MLNAAPPASSTGATETVASCVRYAPLKGNGSLDYCPAYMFDQSVTVGCDNLVYERYDSAVYEVSWSFEEIKCYI